VQQTQPTPVDTTATAESAILSAATALPPASGPSDAVQPTPSDTVQTSNFIPATVKPAPAPAAPATPGVDVTAADQLRESGSQATAVPTDAGQQAGASQGAAAAIQTAQQPATAAATATTATTTATAGPDTAAAQTVVGATTAAGQAGAATAKHTAKTAGPGAAAQGDAQSNAPATTTATAPAQAPSVSAGAGDADQNGAGRQPQPQPNQAPPNAVVAGSQSRPEQAAPPQAANATTPTPGLAAPITAQTAAMAPTADTAAAAGPARYGIGLSEAVETVQTTIELGARQGFSQAKIQLAPATLGQITIHLQKTSDGIVAKVIADHSAAAQTMQQGGDDLRRSLQNSGLHLLRLDIETRGDQRGSAGNSGHTSESGRAAGDNDAADIADDGASQPTTIVLPNGALVNVLA
jgi:flagellar hook-length control protein FliK